VVQQQRDLPKSILSWTVHPDRIVDSANLNKRSMNRGRDLETAVVIYDNKDEAQKHFLIVTQVRETPLRSSRLL